MLGAEYIEKHITLDRSMWGTDQSASVEERGLEYIVRDCKLVRKMYGSENKIVYPEEIEKIKSIRYW